MGNKYDIKFKFIDEFTLHDKIHIMFDVLPKIRPIWETWLKDKRTGYRYGIAHLFGDLVLYMYKTKNLIVCEISKYGDNDKPNQ